MADLRKHSSTSNLIRFTLKNSSTGVGLTGLSSASSGLIISTICDNEATATVYTVAASNVETITTLGTFAAPTASKCRFKEVEGTNHKGLYEFQFADARFSVASSKRLVISVTGATSLLDADYEIQLVQFDPYSATNLGLTNLDAAISSRSTYAGGDTAGTTTLLDRATEVRLAELDAANLPADIAAVKVDTAAILIDTAEIGVAGAGLTGVAALILLTPANKLATDTNGYVTEANVDGVKKNTALANFMFLMVDATDGQTAETGLTVTATRSIDGAAFGACANAVSEIGVGMYKINLAAADLNGDVITFRFAATGALDRFVTIKTNT